MMTDTQLNALFNKQLQYYPVAGNSTASQRIAFLKTLEKTLLQWRSRIHQALHQDFGKPSQEVDLVDIYFVLSEIRYVRKHLREWMQSHRVSTPLAFAGSRAFYRYEAKGVTLIISPWNYPINLTLGPLVSAIAAGCTAIIKPSEYTPATSTLMREMLESIFPTELVAVAEGDAAVSQKLISLPFHHIFFTGSSRVGKIVMEAAAKNLASVTLELGGKCPVVVDSSANIMQAAHRIVHTKFVNAGQTCIAPDYVLVQSSVEKELLLALKEKLKVFYPDDKTLQEEYCGIIHEKHREKMLAYISDAIRMGAKSITGGEQPTQTGKLKPTILVNVSPHAQLMQEEIFGPILPVVRYKTIDEAISFINKMERPLGLYAFGKRDFIKDLMKNTRAGGSCINHCALNYYNPELPFGGVNQSGIGKSHGLEGFKAFSNTRGFYKQLWPYSPIDWLHAPYTKSKQRLIDFVLKWL